VQTETIDEDLSEGFPTQSGGIAVCQVKVMGKQHSQGLRVIHGWW
jgi:hypothetical protein